MTETMDHEKQRAAKWFRVLRDEICSAFEGLENQTAQSPDLAAGRFEYKPTKRQGEGDEDAGGGTMAVMRGGRVFEKVGVNISEVYGTLAPSSQKAMTARKDMPGLAEDPRFWASGISLVAHMRSPKVPAVHMNTRMFWTPGGWWFGGGADLNAPLPEQSEVDAFHSVLKAHCDKHNPEYYPRYKAWADEYFMIKHWGHARGQGGIFYDDHTTGDWEADFAFTQDVGRAFVAAFVPLVAAKMEMAWTEAERETQLVYRGKYAEFNLVYDRGTHFGLASGHNPEAVLMSLPPVAKWP